MNNPFDEIRAAVNQARELDRAIANQANALADLLSGHLRDVYPHRLKQIKTALRDFNAQTGKWKGR